MEVWWRVFGTSEAEPAPAALLEHLQQQGFEVSGRFRGDDHGWFAVEIAFANGIPALNIERYLTGEDDIRNELNAWAAWLETCEGSPYAVELMQQMIATKQLFTLKQPVSMAGVVARWTACPTVCQFLARVTTGVYQVDEQGFFAGDGTPLVRAAVRAVNCSRIRTDSYTESP
jgi:hypothetical protein